jgi:hypothetical protein
MPLQFATQTQGDLNFVDQQLDAYARRRHVIISSVRAGSRAARVKQPTRPRLKAANDSYAPHPLYFMVIENLLSDGAGLDAARPWGFYYVLEDNHHKPFARAHVVADATVKLSLASLSFGAYSQDVVPALERMAVHDQVQAGSYEVRSLRCKHLFFAAIWLKALDGGADLIHPLEKNYHLLESEPPYLAVEYIAALRPVAEKFRAKYRAFGTQLRKEDSSGLAP